MKTLNNIKKLVKSILEEDEEARNNDNYLYLSVLHTVAVRDKLPYPHHITVEFFLENMSKLGYPPFESVRRARQKLQAECPGLSACKKVEELRAENEAAYREFARA